MSPGNSDAARPAYVLPRTARRVVDERALAHGTQRGRRSMLSRHRTKVLRVLHNVAATLAMVFRRSNRRRVDANRAARALARSLGRIDAAAADL
jgi:hypothetical protein